MNPSALLLTAGLFLVVVAPLRADDKADLKPLVGTWNVSAFETDDKKLADEQVKDLTVTFNADGTWNVKKGDKAINEGTFKIDASKKPMTINSTSGLAKGDELGIYEVKDDVMKFCAAAVGKDRPTEFGTKEGSGHTYFLLKRAKP